MMKKIFDDIRKEIDIHSDEACFMPDDTMVVSESRLKQILDEAEAKWKADMRKHDIEAKAIVQEVARDGGWIPCSSGQMPKIYGNTSDTVLVCCSNGFQYMAFWCDDLQWRFCECGTAKEPVLWTNIIAWQPLPAPYRKGEQHEPKKQKGE